MDINSLLKNIRDKLSGQNNGSQTVHTSRDSDISERAQKISQVTSNSKLKDFSQKGVGIIVVISSALILFNASSKSNNDGTKGPSVFSTHHESSTLTENLSEMSRQESLENRPVVKEPVKVAAITKGSAYDEPLRQNQSVTFDEAHKLKAASISKALLKRMGATTTFMVSVRNDVPNEHIKRTSSNPNNQYRLNQNERFLASAQAVTTASAKRLPHPEYTIPSGDVISATLMTAINTSLPGHISAMVSRDVYSLTGQNVLLPKGSLVEGSYGSQVVQGQARILTMWNRVRLPNGVVVDLKAPGTDAIGRSGIGADAVNNHFIQRFGSSVMLSVLGYAAATSGVGTNEQMNSASVYRSAIAESLQAASSQQLQENMTIPPTLDVHQGDKINIFVNQDLSFYEVMKGSDEEADDSYGRTK